MKQLPVDVSVFAELINNNYLYVDKTKHIYTLFSQGRRFFFLSRPRRFGKSLLISTLSEMFSGNKELFRDLWIYTSDFAWKQHPIIHLDFSDIEYENPKELKISLMYHLDRIAEDYGVDISIGYSPKTKMKLLVQKIADRGKVVILIDEYGKPIIDYINNPSKAEANRAILKSFYDGFKGFEKYLRAIFITGVSRFAKTSIFSGMNNLKDISSLPISAQLIGYTEDEILNYFPHYIKKLADAQDVSKHITMENIRHWYNGYQFSMEPIKIYNPFSVVNLFDNNIFDNYWFTSGTPSFLISFLSSNKTSLKNIHERAFTLETLTTLDLDDVSIVTLLYQAGYLTIKEYDQAGFYRLNYPNEEIKQSLMLIEIAVLTGKNRETVNSLTANLKFALKHNDMESFVQNLRSLLASIPYNLHISRESYYHSLLQMICTLLSIENACEVSTSKGSIDLVIESPHYLYICEFKYNKPPRTALEQILKKKYYQKYETENREVILLGISFYLTEDGIELDWISDTLNNSTNS